MTKSKTIKVQVSGVVVKAELKQFDAHNSGRYGREQWDVKVLVAIRTDDGKDYWFFTPAADYSANTSGPYTVTIVDSTDWVTSKRWSTEGVNGAKGIGREPESRVKVGDRVKVEGRVKGEGKFGVQLWYVKRLDYSYDAVVATARERVSKAQKTVPGVLPGNATPPEIPGIKWRHIGGYPQNCDPDKKETWYPSGETFPDGTPTGHAWLRWESEVENAKLLVAHVEGVDPATVEVDPK